MSAVESWFAATAVAEPLPAPARRRRRGPERPHRAPKAPGGSRRASAASPATLPASAPQTQTRARRRHVHRLRGHLVWMVLFALLLVGVVAMNVAVLRANVAVNKLDHEIAQKQAQNQTLASRLSAARSAPRVEAEARKLGLIEAPAADTGYLDLRRP